MTINSLLVAPDLSEFIYALSYLFLGFSAGFMYFKHSSRGLPWQGIFFWGIFSFFRESIPLFSFFSVISNNIHIMTTLDAFSVFFLVEVGRVGNNRLRESNYKYYVHLPLLLSLLLFYATQSINLIIIMKLIGSIGGAWATTILYTLSKSPAESTKVRKLYRVLTILFGLYLLSFFFAFPKTLTLPFSIINKESFQNTFFVTITFVRGIIAYLSGLALILLVLYHTHAIAYPNKIKSYYKGIFLCGLTLCIIFYICSLYINEVEDIKTLEVISLLEKDAQFSVQEINQLNILYTAAAKTLADSPESVRYMETFDPALENKINEKIDIIKQHYNASAVYIMNKTGTTILSTNRNTSESFVGKNYGFRPYFKDAMETGEGLYFARGVTSLARGIYYSSVILDKDKKEKLGVAIIKATPEHIISQIKHMSLGHFVSPDSVIFTSSKPDWRLYTLFPLSDEDQNRLISSKQFSKAPLPSFNFKKINERFMEDHEGKRYLFVIKNLSLGWYILVMEPFSTIENAREKALFNVFPFVLLFIFGFFGLLRTYLDTLELTASEEKYRDLFEHANDLIQSVNKDGTFLYVNNAWKNALGYSDDDVKNLNLFDIVHPSSMQHCQNLFKELMQGKEVEKVEATFRTKSGRPIDVSGNVSVHREEGLVVATRAIFRDITEQKYADEEIKKRLSFEKVISKVSSLLVTKKKIEEAINIGLEEISRLINADHAGLYLYNEEKKVIAVNEWYNEHIGSLKNTMLGSPLDSFAWSMKTLQTQRFIQINSLSEMPKEAAPEKIFLESINVKSYVMIPILLGGIRKGVLAFSIKEEKKWDIDDISLLQLCGEFFGSSLWAQESHKLIKLERNRAELFMDLLAHDINNLNLPVRSYMELMLMNKEFPEKFQKYARNVLKQSTSISRLITNVKQLALLHPDEFTLKKINLSSMLEESQKRVQLNFPNKKIHMTMKKTKETAFVNGSNLLNDVFDNLLGNALKYNDKDTAEISIELEKIKGGNDEYYQVIIKDNGPGIPDSMKEQIFQRLARGEESIHGSGLGLAIVREVTSLCGGKVWVEDRVAGDHSQGAVFIVLLPLERG